MRRIPVFVLIASTLLGLAALGAQAAQLKGVTLVEGESGTRAVLDLTGPVDYKVFTLANPDRLFFDFRDTAAAEAALPPLDRLAGSVVRDVRIGSHPGQTTRLVLELEPNTRHSVFALYNPYRLVVDLEELLEGPRCRHGPGPGPRLGGRGAAPGSPDATADGEHGPGRPSR